MLYLDVRRSSVKWLIMCKTSIFSPLFIASCKLNQSIHEVSNLLWHRIELISKRKGLFSLGPETQIVVGKTLVKWALRNSNDTAAEAARTRCSRQRPHHDRRQRTGGKHEREAYGWLMTKRDISCDTRLLPCDTSLSLFFTHAAHFTEALILGTELEPDAGTGSGVQTPIWAGGD